MSTPVSWRRYNIFISSTFKDMDFERDVIKFRVIPALNRRFRDQRVELQAIDLRLGVNTQGMSEEDSERKVLSVCTSCIDSSRPFFIGLIGQRYGWIPPVERWKEFMQGLTKEEREILKDTAGCSVTEMEIVYGALSQGNFDSSHVLFYLRDDASYEGIPEDLKPAFCDADPDNLRRLAILKKKVQELFGERAGEDDRCTPYHLDWTEGHFCSDEFEAIITGQLARQIELETAREETAADSTWWVQEKDMEESHLLKLLPVAIETRLIPDIIEDDPGEEEQDERLNEEYDVWDSIVGYMPGMGASTHMAVEYDSWREEKDTIRLLAVFGISEYSTSMRPVLARWIHELAEICGEEDLPDDEELLGSMPVSELNELFASLVETARDRGFYIYIFLDELETLEASSPDDLYMTWLNRISDRVNVLVNLQYESEARKRFRDAHPDIKLMFVPMVWDETVDRFISAYEKNYFLELPSGIKEQMHGEATYFEDNGVDESLTAVRIHSLFRIFESLTQEDFATIRSSSGSQIDAINSYLEDIWKEMPSESYELNEFMGIRISENLSLGERWTFALWHIAAAPSGLREKDIADYMGNEWDAVQFYRLMNFLNDFFYEDRTRHLWKAKYLTRPEDGLQRYQRGISGYLITLDPNDSLRQEWGLYYALKGGEPEHLDAYLLDADYADLPPYEWECLRLQTEMLLREEFLDGKEFKDYCLSLEAGPRLHLMRMVQSGLNSSDPRDLNRIVTRMAGWLKGIQVKTLSATEALFYTTIACFRDKSEEFLMMSLRGAKRFRELAEDEWDGDNRVMIALVSLLDYYKEKGNIVKAEGVRDEIRDLARNTEGITARINALDALYVAEKNVGEEFFDLFYSDEDYTGFYSAAELMMRALQILEDKKDYDRLLAEAIRFLTFMQDLYDQENFFENERGLVLFIDIHDLILSCGENKWAYMAHREGYLMLNDVCPSHWMLEGEREYLAEAAEDAADLRKELGAEGLSYKEIDDRIIEEYAKTQN